MTNSQPFVLIGLGAVGRALAPALVRAGYTCCGLVGRGRSGEKALARRCRTQLFEDFDALPDDFQLLFLCVRDNQLAPLARNLAAQCDDWIGKTVFHTAGAVSSDVLTPLREAGAEVASFHPFGSFPSSGAPIRFAGLTFGIEGTPEAERIAQRVARDLGGKALIIPPDKRALYHLAAVFASNFFVGDLVLATEMLERVGLDEAQALQVLLPIVEGTFRNVKKLGVRSALTGPAIRGEIETLARHEAALRAVDPQLAELYRKFSEYLGKLSA
jgi:predicted short-subunit dehydrogenase-like oxidoreductase (DUF2520 family)